MLETRAVTRSPANLGHPPRDRRRGLHPLRPCERTLQAQRWKTIAVISTRILNSSRLGLNELDSSRSPYSDVTLTIRERTALAGHATSQNDEISVLNRLKRRMYF